MKILIAWELGDNYGHILRQLPIAKELRAHGHEILFAVKNIYVAEKILAIEGFSFVQAPVPRRMSATVREISSFADILIYHGFGELDVLKSLIHSWKNLYQIYKPDVVIIDHSPAALFSARLKNIRTAEIGTGFECPPAISPYPCFRPWLKLTKEDLLKTEKRILENLNSVCRLQGRPLLNELFEAMQSDVRFLVTLPEIDHYPRRKEAVYLGPLYTLNEGEQINWPKNKLKNIFVYVRPSPVLISILDSLKIIKANIICVVPGIDEDIAVKYRSSIFHISSSHVKLQQLLKRCDVVVTYCGHGILGACMISGVPILAVPIHMEQNLLASCLNRTEAGIGLSLSQVEEKFFTLLSKLLEDPTFKDRAQVISRKYRDINQDKLVAKIVDIIERLPKRSFERVANDKLQ